MIDYFYKFVLKTLLLIGGMELSPGPKQGLSCLRKTKDLEQFTKQQTNVLEILQQKQERLTQIQKNLQQSQEVKQTVQQLQEDPTN